MWIRCGKRGEEKKEKNFFFLNEHAAYMKGWEMQMKK